MEGQRMGQGVPEEDEAILAQFLQITEPAREELRVDFSEDLFLDPEVITIIGAEIEDGDEKTSEVNPLISYGVSERFNPAGGVKQIFHDVMRNGMFLCKICGVPFSYRPSLTRHMAMHSTSPLQLQKSSELIPEISGDGTRSINQTGSLFSNNNNNNLEERNGREEMFGARSKCKTSVAECLVPRKRPFLDAGGNGQTFNVEIQCQTFNCEICCSPFANRGTFTQHMKKHGIILINKYSCSSCKKDFAQKSSLDGHIARKHKKSSLGNDNEEGKSASDRVTQIVIEEDHEDNANTKYITIHTQFDEDEKERLENQS